MLPTVDFCFKELMQNSRVRKGFIAALLDCDPGEIDQTVLMPTILDRNTPDDKQGILDVRVALSDGTQLDMEMQVSYFAFWEKRILFYLAKMYTEQLQKGESYKKLQKCIHVSIRENLLDWIQFFGGSSRKEFADMAKKNEYLDEAYNELLQLSADEQKRLEYEAREKALKDYNTQMDYALEQGFQQGMERGMKQGIKQGIEQGINQGIERGIEQGRQQTKKIFKLYMQGKVPEEIAEICEISVEEVKAVLE